mgnify:CR=1 FL=1
MTKEELLSMSKEDLANALIIAVNAFLVQYVGERNAAANLWTSVQGCIEQGRQYTPITAMRADVSTFDQK